MRLTMAATLALQSPVVQDLGVLPWRNMIFPIAMWVFVLAVVFLFITGP